MGASIRALSKKHTLSRVPLEAVTAKSVFGELSCLAGIDEFLASFSAIIRLDPYYEALYDEIGVGCKVRRRYDCACVLLRCFLALLWRGDALFRRLLL